MEDEGISEALKKKMRSKTLDIFFPSIFLPSFLMGQWSFIVSSETSFGTQSG